MASPQIVGNSFYKIFPYNPTRIESTNSVFLIHLFANFTRHSLSIEASTTFTNVVVLFRDTLMNNSTDAKAILEKSLAGVHLPSPMFPDGQVISCSVCFENIVVGLEATKLTCGHRYHEECIVKWLQTSKFCPLCRSEVA
ncbi:hypothetical protein G4B88_006501 [Cannabis sativa]|uniref:RING-type E3 ubiquitin transferase n=1 Tax=Cannabis sativa TaxID=3483 RepID=A0A7J6H2H3_CANSA|nr:hypothetical protein G4B88_006501 [Cannabis sativa]